MAYTIAQKEERFNNILEYIRNGSALRNCFDKPDTFSKTVWDALIKDNEKNTQYARACEDRADAIFEDILNIADNVEQDIVTLPDGREVENKAVIARDRLRVEARKWAASKMNPKKYGDKLDQNINHSGEIKTNHTKLTQEQIDKAVENL